MGAPSRLSVPLTFLFLSLSLSLTYSLSLRATTVISIINMQMLLRNNISTYIASQRFCSYA